MFNSCNNWKTRVAAPLYGVFGDFVAISGFELLARN
jgi:hypothetical protein